MSVEAMSYVWKTKLKSSQKLMLLAIADRCDELGVCYPGVERLARKCSVNKRSAQKLIHRLEEAGEIAVVEHAGIDTRGGKTNRYFMKKYRDELGIQTPEGRVKDDMPSNKGDVQSDTTSGGVNMDTGGVSKTTPPGASNVTPPGVSNTTPNTSDKTTGYPTDKTTVLDAADTPPGEPSSEVNNGVTNSFESQHQQFCDAVAEALQFENSTDRRISKIAISLQQKHVMSLKELRAFGLWYQDKSRSWSAGAHIRKLATVDKYVKEFRADDTVHAHWMTQAAKPGGMAGYDFNADSDVYAVPDTDTDYDEIYAALEWDMVDDKNEESAL